jgi:hypothetical protein
MTINLLEIRKGDNMDLNKPKGNDTGIKPTYKVYMRDEDGYLLCQCGCNERFNKQKKASYVTKLDIGVFYKECYAIGTEVKFGTIDGLVDSTHVTGIGKLNIELLQQSILGLSNKDTYKLYRWMHEALGCRI